MRVLVNSFVILAAACILCCTGVTVRQTKPLKFLVLQKSDILSDVNVIVNKPDVNAIEGNATSQVEEDEKIATTTDNPETDTEEDDSKDDVVHDNVETTTFSNVNKPYNPVEAWKELDFPVIPEASVNTSGEVPSPPQVVDISGTRIEKISNGIFSGKAVCQCGVSSDRIVNGEVAKLNEIPWTVGLARSGFFGFGASKKPYCGGTLINDRYVLTASHCVDAMFASGIKVWMNDQDLIDTSETQGGRQVYDVAQIIMHPKYDRRTVNYDIALLKLAKPVPIEFSQDSSFYLPPACIPVNNDNDFSGENGTVAGWGVTSQGGSQSNTLMKVDVPIITNEQCNTQTQYKDKITENMMCAGFIETGGKDSCQGDSGGPFIINNNNRKTLVGIVSWGFGCAQPKAPGVYTRVGRFIDWILEKTKDADYCSS